MELGDGLTRGLWEECLDEEIPINRSEFDKLARCEARLTGGWRGGGGELFDPCARGIVGDRDFRTRQGEAEL